MQPKAREGLNVLYLFTWPHRVLAEAHGIFATVHRCSHATAVAGRHAGSVVAACGPQ